jgi:hypothetical protein
MQQLRLVFESSSKFEFSYQPVYNSKAKEKAVGVRRIKFVKFGENIWLNTMVKKYAHPRRQ